MKTPTPKKPPVPKPSQSSATADHPTPVGTVRNCTTCVHRFPGRQDPLEILAHLCLVSGNSICLTRRDFPAACNKAFSAWQPQPVQVAGSVLIKGNVSISGVNCESDGKPWPDGMSDKI